MNAVEKLTQPFQDAAVESPLYLLAPDEWNYRASIDYPTAFARNPDLVGQLIMQENHAFHGTRSSSLLSILRHGLVPRAHQLQDDKIASVTAEFSSCGSLRDYVSVVGMLNVKETKRYAEDGDWASLSVDQLDKIATAQYDSPPHPGTIIHEYTYERTRAAQRMLQHIGSLAVGSTEHKLIMASFPIVVSASMADVDEQRVELIPSCIRGEFGIHDTIPTSALRSVFAPEAEHPLVAHAQEEAETELDVYALEDLRATFG